MDCRDNVIRPKNVFILFIFFFLNCKFDEFIQSYFLIWYVQRSAILITLPPFISMSIHLTLQIDLNCFVSTVEIVTKNTQFVIYTIKMQEQNENNKNNEH